MTPQELHQLQNRLFELLEPAVVAMAYELVAVELVTVGGRRTVRVSVDRPAGVDFKDLSRISHALSALLDVDDPIPGAYDLELSSPGIERPLQRPGDFARFLGFRAKIQLMPDHARRRFTGILRAFEPGPAESGAQGRVSIEVDGVLHHIDLHTIQRAHLALDLAEFEALATAQALARAQAQETLAPESTPDSGGSS